MVLLAGFSNFGENIKKKLLLQLAEVTILAIVGSRGSKVPVAKQEILGGEMAQWKRTCP